MLGFRAMRGGVYTIGKVAWCDDMWIVYYAGNRLIAFCVYVDGLGP